MKALVKEKPREGTEWTRGLQLVETSQPSVTERNEVLIKVFAAAICGTDVGIYDAKESLRVEMSRAVTDPIIIGHEFSGWVVDAGTAARRKIAGKLIEKARTHAETKRLLRGLTESQLASAARLFPILGEHFHASAEMHVTCGTCYQCRLGEKHVCRNTIIKGVHDHGAFAEYVNVPVENLVLFHRREIPPEIIAFMDALGNATHTVMSVDVKGKSVAVLGCGVQGLMATAVAKAAGAKRIYVTDASHGDLSHEKLEAGRFNMARGYGATDCFDMMQTDERTRFHDVIMKDTHSTGVDAAFEMSGSYPAYEDALRALRMGGSFSLLGLPSGTMPVDFARDVIFKGITIRGIIGRRVFQTWEQMEQLLKNGLAKKLLKSGFITHEFPLDQYEEAFAAIRRGDAYKVLLKPPQ